MFWIINNIDIKNAINIDEITHKTHNSAKAGESIITEIGRDVYKNNFKIFGVLFTFKSNSFWVEKLIWAKNYCIREASEFDIQCFIIISQI